MIGQKSIPSRQGGVEIVVGELSKRLAEDGYTVEAYNRAFQAIDKASDTATDKASEKASNGAAVGSDPRHYGKVRIRTIPTLPNGGLNALVYAYLATIRALFGHYDIYHYHAEGPCNMLWLLGLFHKKIVVTIHGLDWQRAKWGNMASGVILRGEKRAVKYADKIIVLSKAMQKYFADTYGRETVYIPNGADSHERVEADQIKGKFGLESGKYILFLARLVPEKGAHYLIDAFKSLDTDMKLVIAGGSGQTDDYVEELKRRTADDARIIMTGFAEGRILEELYSNAYIYVLPSDVEGMALSLLEAASFGNCCLVSDIPENTEVLEDNCVTFAHGDIDDLAEKLRELIADPSRVENLRTRSAEHIREKFSWDEMTKQTEAIYSEIMSKK
ncbi:MAG: glycosyltransferase family 4 protein [Lachnospiraceae bacterium]|nr:glycosyltransferase family 4 protein [Lachnospiraceae bacterium]